MATMVRATDPEGARPTEAEASFRAPKGELSIRPLFHQWERV
jgi:hypothetical protein